MTITHEPAAGPFAQLWAELGQECQLECVHCYAASGPGRGFGTMTPGDWEHVITQAAGLGCRHVTFIGGEPTMHPALGRLVRHALSLGMNAEIYTNLVHVTPAMWELFQTPGVSVAASWYTSSRDQHKAITGGHDTWRQTKKNFQEAARRGIPVRAGIVDGIVPGQRTRDGEEQLRALGITSTGTDRLRDFGRGTLPAPGQACGRCGNGRAAVLPDGTVSPCPMTRWMNAGNVRETGLEAILETVTALAAALPARAGRACHPDDCRPDVFCPPLCSPSVCTPSTR